MRSYTYKTGAMGEVLKRWEAAVPHREEQSPLAAAWYTELGGLNKVGPHLALQGLGRAQQDPRRGGQVAPLAPPTREFLMSQENKIMVPASFSPTH